MRIDQPVYSVRRWPGLRSEFSWLPPDGSVTTTAPNQIGVSFSAHDRVGHEAAGRSHYIDIPPGAVFANGSYEVHWADVRQPTEALEIYPDADRLSGVEIEPAVARIDATVLGIAAVFKRAHVLSADPDPMQASTLVHRLVTHLLEHYAHPRRRPGTGPGRLDRRQVDRVAEFIEDHLDAPLVLDDLARQASLSPYRFARAFKSTTGMSPHEFVTMRRLERAKSLLIRTGRSVAEVAHAVGYSNVGHFRRLLRRHTGLRPADLRRHDRETARLDPPDVAGSVRT
jgi:AraC family transcriptional regulator